MDAALLQLKGERYTRAKDWEARRSSGWMESTDLHGTKDPTPEKMEHRGKKKLPRELTWFAVQAVNLDPATGSIQLRSFPFWTFSLEHARHELLEMGKKDPAGCPYTHIFQYAALTQASGKMSKCKLEKSMININTGEKR